MKKQISWILIIILTLILVIGFGLYVLKHFSTTDKKEVTATFYPYYLMLKELGVNGSVVIDPYANPHTYTPKVSDYAKLENAKYVIVDGYIDSELIKNVAKEKILDPTPYRHGWFRLDTIFVLEQMLKERGINANIPKELEELNQEYKSKFDNITAVTLHKGLEDALAYYGIKVIRALVAHDEDVLSINDINYLKNTNACLIIATSPAQVDMLKKYGMDDKVVYIHLMGRKYEENESYLEIMKKNLKAIENASKRCNRRNR